MNRETKPTKTRETNNRFGIAELSIGALLKVSLNKILPFSYGLHNRGQGPRTQPQFIICSSRENIRPGTKPKPITYEDLHFILITNRLPQDPPTALGQDTPT
jgi:hypothetical protein